MPRASELVSFLVVGVGFASSPAFAGAAEQASDLQVALLERAKEVVARDLKDPSSAQFRNLRTSTVLPGYVCGEMNAKNSFGGYVGFISFYYKDSDGKVLLLDPDDRYFESRKTMFELVCPAEQ